MHNSAELAAAAEGLAVKEVTDTAAWDALKAPWRQLYDASPTAAPPLSWEWLRTWWDIYGPIYGQGPRGLRIQTVWRGDQLIAALPLYLRSGAGSALAPVRLCLLSTGEDEFEETCAEYLDLLHLPGEGPLCVRLLLDRLRRQRAAWDELDFSHLAADAALAQGLDGVSQALTLQPDRPSYLVDLSSGFDAYVRGLSNRMRGNAQRLLRQFEEAQGRFEVATEPAQIGEFFGQLVELHQARWRAVGKPGTFAAPRFEEFHHSLCRQLCPTGAAVLARLSHEEQPLCVLLTYVAKDAAHYYVSGSRRNHALIKSPGIAAHLLLKRQLAEQGVKTFDYLPGSHDYKVQYATSERAMVRLSLTRPTLRSGLQAARTLAGRVARRMSRIVRKPRRVAEAPPADLSS